MKPFILNEDGKPCIWPIPQNCTWNVGRYTYKSCLHIFAEKEFVSEAAKFAEILRDEFSINAVLTDGDADLTICKCDTEETGEEGYILDVSNEGIYLQGFTVKGVFYGCMTLIQLFVNSPGSSIAEVHIQDKPLKAFRGVHAYLPTREDIAKFKRFIDFLAKYKINKLILEVGASIRFDSHPEIWQDGDYSQSKPVEKEEFNELLKYIRDRHIEVIPKLNVLSGSHWLLAAHKELAECINDPFPDIFCPSNNEVYRIYFECLEEIVRLFSPHTVHIGLEAVYQIGVCEKCRGKSGNVLLSNCINRIYDWFDERGIRVMMSSERLQPDTGGEHIHHNRHTLKNETIPSTFSAVNETPKDIILVTPSGEDGIPETQWSDYFSNQGFNEVLGRFPREKAEGSKAFISKVYDILKASCKLWWNGYRKDSTSVGLNMPDYLERVAAQLYPVERDMICKVRNPSSESSHFKTIYLKPLYNFPLRRFKYRKDDFDFTFLVDEDFIPNTVPFSILQGVDDLYMDHALMIAGNGWNTGIYGVAVGLKPLSLAFMHTLILDRGCSQEDTRNNKDNKDNNVVGYYIVHYMDETVEKVLIEYNRTICYYVTGLEPDSGACMANPVIKGITKYGLPYTIYSQEWINPKPEVEIRSIDVVPRNESKEEGMALFGITAIL